MMSEGSPQPAAVPAGWYRDPAGSRAERWWDGTAWTATLRPLPDPAQLQPAPTPASQAAASQATAYVPFQSSAAIARATERRGSAYTPAMWWISAQPFWGVATQVVIVAALNTFLPGLPLAPIVIGYVVLNFILLGVLVALAFSDRAGLVAGGNQSSASPWWILLSPFVYLLLRARQIALWEEGGWAGFLWWCLAAVVSPVLAIVGYFAVLGAVPV